MTWLVAGQFAMPLILIGWLMLVPARSGAGFGVHRVFLVTLALVLVSLALRVTWRFEGDMRRAVVLWRTLAQGRTACLGLRNT